MSEQELQKLYESHVKPLRTTDRLRLLAMTAQDLVGESSAMEPQPKRSILDLHGLGKDIWEGMDAQLYVGHLRDEWEPKN